MTYYKWHRHEIDIRQRRLLDYYITRELTTREITQIPEDKSSERKGEKWKK